ncbi:SH3 and multiple ankyrin repeat domains protein 1 [Trichonephila clavipes]|nr:SH3 and multiple ankyrin repeat domains protein 1 [Trichonephila clavipes]
MTFVQKLSTSVWHPTHLPPANAKALTQKSFVDFTNPNYARLRSKKYNLSRRKEITLPKSPHYSHEWRTNKLTSLVERQIEEFDDKKDFKSCSTDGFKITLTGAQKPPDVKNTTSEGKVGGSPNLQQKGTTNDFTENIYGGLSSDIDNQRDQTSVLSSSTEEGSKADIVILFPESGHSLEIPNTN